MNFLKFVFIASFTAPLLQYSAGNDQCPNADGSFCLKNGQNIVSNYVGNDQCMALPGHTQMHANSLAFFLQDHQFCGGGPSGMDGLLICYTGQLDPQGEMLARGVRHSILYQLENAPGNKVAAKCRDLVGKDWHGLLLSTDDDGNWVFRLSTTSNTFVVKRSELGWLIIKLASAKDGGESFLSKSFGPLRDFTNWGKRQPGKREEEKNRIRHKGDEQLKKLYFNRVESGAKLGDYPGLWTIGLDMLPFHEDTHQIVLFVNRSECCADIQAWFNVPTGEQPIPNVKKVEQKDGIDMEGSLVENFGGILDGVVDRDAKMLVFEMTDLFHPKGKAQGMRLKVNFEDNSIVFEHKLDDQWTVPELAKPLQNHFRRGAQFHLVFILRKRELVINMNCYGEVKLPAGADILFENTHRIKISGGYKLVKSFRMGGHGVKFIVGKSWPIAEGVSAKNNNSGIMIEGKIEDNADGFSIKLWNRDKEGDGLYNCMLELKVGIAKPGIEIFDGTGKSLTGDDDDEINLPSYEWGSHFEALFQFTVNGTLNVWMDNTLLLQYENPAGLRVVNYVQIVGRASGNMTLIPKLPFFSRRDFKMSFDNKECLKIDGKVLPYDEQKQPPNFKIPFFGGKNAKLFEFNVDFTGKSDSQIILQETDHINGISVKFENKKLLEIGKLFHIRFEFKSDSEIAVSVNGVEKVLDGKQDYGQVTKFEIRGSILIMKQSGCKESKN